MNDRELLEAAAKAAGYGVDIVSSREQDGTVSFYMKPDMLWWNPLTDDGDALRLAVHLFINIEHLKTMSGMCAGVHCWPAGRGDCGHTEGVGLDDYCAATRRAIVRAAAAMAKEPKP